jgi:hypothetical protein
MASSLFELLSTCSCRHYLSEIIFSNAQRAGDVKHFSAFRGMHRFICKGEAPTWLAHGQTRQNHAHLPLLSSWDLFTESWISAVAIMLPYSPCIFHSDQRVAQERPGRKAVVSTEGELSMYDLTGNKLQLLLVPSWGLRW